MKQILKKHLFFLFLLAFTASMPGAAEAGARSGSAGAQASWAYRPGSKTLEISGSGPLMRLPPSAGPDLSRLDIDNIVIGEGITSIDEPGFLCLDGQAGSRSVKKAGGKPVFIKSSRTLKLPKSLSSITPGAFARTSVEKVTVAPGNKYFKVMDNILYSKDGSVLVYCPRGWKGSTCRIPAGVRTVGALAFARCINLKRAVLPEDLETLGPGAFFGCTALKKINLAQARKLEAITDYDGYSRGFYLVNGSTREMEDVEDRAYYDRAPAEIGGYPLYLYYMGTFEGTRLASVRIPDNVRFLAEETFRDCTRLREITFGRNFEGGINQRTGQRGKTVLLYELDLRSIRFAGGSSRFCIRDGILCSSDGTVLYQYLEKQNSSRTSLSINSGVSLVAEGAFFHSCHLRSVVCRAPLEQVGKNAFAACDRLKSFRADGDIGCLGMGAFFDCWHLKSFLCRGSIGFVDSQAFYHCFNMKKAQAAGLPLLADDTVFEYCTALPEKAFTLYTPPQP